MLKLGSHVGMSGKEMLLGSAKEAVSYGANTFMFYTGAPQNTRRKEISELNIEPAWEYMKEHGIDEIVVHAPYIINLGNSVKPGDVLSCRRISGKRNRPHDCLQKPHSDPSSGCSCRCRCRNRNCTDHQRTQ